MSKYNDEIREYVAAPAVQGEPVAWSLRFRHGDKYERVGPVNYMTTFGSKEDADIYANRVARDLDGNPKPERMPVVVPLYTAPQPAEQPDVTQLVEALEQGFPLLSDEGLDEVEHHCEWAIQRERKRVHSILAAHRKQGGK